MNGSREFRRRQRQLGAKYDTFGNKLTWFGYKVHLAVDAKSELPIALDVTPANVYDGEMAIPLMKEIHERNWRFQFVMMDAGYDQAKNGEAARQYGAQAIIALNKRGEKEPLSASHPTERSAARWVTTQKERLTMNDAHVRGIQKVTIHVYINAVVLLAAALAVSAARREKESA
nr:transposase [Alicyclobacillus sacchari]